MITVDWKPNRFSPVPIQKQIEQFIKEKIVNGEWTIGTKLPSQRALAQAFDVNRSTVVAALDELTAAGLLAGNTGGGTRVINTTWSLLASVSPTNWNANVELGIHPPNLPTIQEINHAEFRSGIIRLGTGELSPSLLPASEQMQQLFARQAARPIPLGYQEAKGDLFLREQIVQRLKKEGIATSPDSVLIVSGALQALQLIAIGLLKKGSTVLLENPSYLHSLHVFQSAGMKLQGVPMDPDGLQAELLPAYQKQFKGAILYSIPTFHNPTGNVMPAKRREELLRVCDEQSLPIIEDDVYRDLWLDERPPCPIKAGDKNGNVLYLGSMSKSVSPGLRIGWLVGPQPVIERLADIKMQIDYGASSLSQWAAGEWIASGAYDQRLAVIREQLRVRRACMLNALERNCRDLASWDYPTGGFYVWLRMHEAIPMKTLFDRALSAGILLNPGHLYDRQEFGALRLSYAYASLEELQQGISALADIIRTLGATGRT
ncbi:UNVERIFIED_CONTAM: GntR family transcriptional regulator of abcA and norABC [Brevibacillus sp. OAP136]